MLDGVHGVGYNDQNTCSACILVNGRRDASCTRVPPYCHTRRPWEVTREGRSILPAALSPGNGGPRLGTGLMSAAALLLVVGVSAAGRASVGTPAGAAEHVEDGTWRWYSPRGRDASRAVALCAWFNRRASLRERIRVCRSCGRALP